MDLNVIVLAAGKGTRMASPLPKVLHPIAGKSMIGRSLSVITALHPKQIRVVVGHGSHLVSTVAGHFKALCFQQSDKQWGTAGAVLSARPEELNDSVLVLNGDHPLINSTSLISFIHECKKKDLDFAVASFKNPHSKEYGRLSFKEGILADIVETYEIDKKAPTQSPLFNAGIYFTKAKILNQYIKQIQKNIKEEYNFTDMVSILYKNSLKPQAVEVPWNMAFGINNQRELSLANNIVFESNCYRHLEDGVVITDIKNTYIEDDVTIGKGTIIHPGVSLRGKVKIGHFCSIEPNSYIFDSLIESYSNIKAGSYIEGAVVGERSIIGPYAHLRPETVIGKHCRVGNFVETKKIKMGDGSKASHLSYLGDAQIGKDVNIGCGVVTCNYGTDKKKRQTKIEDQAFIGSGSQLIAPLTVGKDAVVGAGSVITKNVPEESLGIERGEQKNIQNYHKHRKDKEKDAKS